MYEERDRENAIQLAELWVGRATVSVEPIGKENGAGHLAAMAWVP